MPELTEPEKESTPTPEAELRAIFRSVVLEHDQSQNNEVREYLQGKKDGIRLAQAILLGDMSAARGIISTNKQWHIPDGEYEVALAVADGRKRE